MRTHRVTWYPWSGGTGAVGGLGQVARDGEREGCPSVLGGNIFPWVFLLKGRTEARFAVLVGRCWPETPSSSRAHHLALIQGERAGEEERQAVSGRRSNKACHFKTGNQKYQLAELPGSRDPPHPTGERGCEYASFSLFFSGCEPRVPPDLLLIVRVAQAINLPAKTQLVPQRGPR